MEQNVFIEAYTEEQAIQESMKLFKNVKTIEKMQNGFAPTKCKVEDKPMSKKKWVTKMYVYTFIAKHKDKNDNDIYRGLKLADIVDSGKKGDAIDRAKEITLETGQPTTIRIVKVIEDDSNLIGDVLPNDGIKGRWKISGTPRSTGIIQEKYVEEMIQDINTN